MRRAEVVSACVVAAAIYGIVHDEITIRFSREYFTLAHPPLFPGAISSTLLAASWGILGTVWLGAAFGVVLASVVNSEGDLPVSRTRVLRALGLLILTTAAGAGVAGYLGFFLARSSLLRLPGIQAAAPDYGYDSFAAVWCAHLASYFVASIGGLILVGFFWRERGKPNVLPLFPRSGWGVVRVLSLMAAVGVIVTMRWLRH